MNKGKGDTHRDETAHSFALTPSQWNKSLLKCPITAHSLTSEVNDQTEFNGRPHSVIEERAPVTGVPQGGAVRAVVQRL